MIRVSEPLGPIEWDGLPCSNHARVWNGPEEIGILMKVQHSGTIEDGVEIPACGVYQFIPLDHTGLPVLASLHSNALLAELTRTLTEAVSVAC